MLWGEGSLSIPLQSQEFMSGGLFPLLISGSFYLPTSTFTKLTSSKMSNFLSSQIILSRMTSLLSIKRGKSFL